MDGEIKVELDRIHDEDNRQNHRLDELEKAQADIRELIVTVKELAMSVQYTNTKLDKVEADVEQIKSAPIKSIAEIKATAIRTVVATLVGALITSFVWMLTANGGI